MVAAVDTYTIKQTVDWTQQGYNVKAESEEKKSLGKGLLYYQVLLINKEWFQKYDYITKIFL